MSPKRSWQIVGICTSIFLIFQIWMQIPVFYVNFSSSLPRGIYFRVPQGKIHVGDYVIYLPPEDVVDVMRRCGWLSEGVLPHLFLKNVAALAGDRYTVSAHSFFVNGQYIGEAIPEDSEGHSLPLASGTHIVPENEFLPVAAYSSRSFDGRYTGTVPLDCIVAKVIPILVVD